MRLNTPIEMKPFPRAARIHWSAARARMVNSYGERGAAAVDAFVATGRTFTSGGVWNVLACELDGGAK